MQLAGTRNWFINLHFGAKISANLFRVVRFARPSPATHKQTQLSVCVCVCIAYAYNFRFIGQN